MYQSQSEKWMRVLGRLYRFGYVDGTTERLGSRNRLKLVIDRDRKQLIGTLR